MNKQDFESLMKSDNAAKVKILTGDHKGLISYVTWCDDEYVSVTPLVFDPLDSVLLKHDEVELT